MNLFTIVTITYNNLEGLKKTYASVITQHYQNFEWLIIDGDSNDGTKDFINSIDDQRVKIYSEEDAGIYDAMNKGLLRAKGYYIIFMNGGDCFYSKTTLEDVYRIANKITPKPHFIYGDAFELNTTTNKMYLKKARNSTWKISGMFTHHQAMFYKREHIELNKLRYNTNFKIASDYELTLRFLELLSSKQILKIDIPICIFSLDGISSKQNKLGFIEQYQIKKQFYPKMLIFPISILQILLITIKKITPFLYNLYRYNKL